MPWLTAGVVLAGVLASFLPEGPALCIYDRGAVRDGEWWRLLSGQLVHSSARLALVDLGVLAALGLWIEGRARAVLAVTMLASALVVGLTVHLTLPELSRFHGASGVACSLFTLVALWLARREAAPALRAVALLALAGFLVKAGWETSTGRALTAAVAVVPAAHLSGGLVGLVVAMLVPPPSHPAAAP